MKSNPLPPLDRVKELLDYDQNTGVFVWRAYRGGTAFAGSIAGGINTSGHRQIKIDMQQYVAHRLAWYLVTGKEPVNEIDHINGNRDDNRYENLREATDAQNAQNRTVQINNKSGVKGVCWYPRRSMWNAYITAFGARKTIGYFKSIEEAASARKSYERMLHKEYARSA
jgi:hypothetical protein